MRRPFAQGWTGAAVAVGATICVKKQGQVCVPPPNPNMGPNTGGRAYWSSTTVDSWVPPGIGRPDALRVLLRE